MKEMFYKNIVLIGMPGSGKTTIGRLLSEKLGIPFIDVDEYIEARENKKIKDIFKKGESFFRKIETDAIFKISQNNPLIISTGGGVIKSKLNIDYLKEKGIIIFIDRAVEDIISDVSISERPLLKDGKCKIYQLFDDRYDLYNKYCDIKVKNNDEIKNVVDKIILSAGSFVDRDQKKQNP